MALTTPIGVINLNKTTQLPAVIFHHDLHEFVLHAQCAIVGNAKLSMKRQGRNPRFILGEKIDTQKSGSQRQLC